MYSVYITGSSCEWSEEVFLESFRDAMTRDGIPNTSMWFIPTWENFYASV